MSELPKGWISCSIFDLCTPKQWKTIPTDALLDNGYVVYGANGIIGKYDQYTHEQPTVMITCRGATCGNVHISQPFSYINGNAMALDNLCIVDLKYIFYYLKGYKFDRIISGSAQPQITQQGMKGLIVQLAPQAEQTRIVEKLDEVLAQVDTIKARLDGIPSILKRFRQSVLAAAVSGRLTEEWRKTQNSDAIKEFSLIAADRVTVVSGKNKQVQPHLKSEEYPIPDSWFWVSLDALTRHIVDGTHHTPTYIESGIPFISVKDIKNGVIDFSDTKFISEEEHVELSKRCCVENGDLLITKSGTIGRTAIVNTDREFSLFVSVALLKPASSLVNMRFVNVALQKWINEIDVSSRIVGSAIKNLHLRDMRVLAIPFAPLEEQKEIVRLVDQYFAFADTIAAQVKKAQTRVDNLTQSILAKAFRGELVAQDPNDEPAEKLLERIAQARKEAEALAKAAKKVAKTK